MRRLGLALAGACVLLGLAGPAVRSAWRRLTLAASAGAAQGPAVKARLALALLGATLAASGAAGAGSPRPGTPGQTLVRFVQAADASDAAGMWALLSASTRARLGPTLAGFRSGAAARLAHSVGSFERRSLRTILSEQLSGSVGVAAVAGGRTARGRKEYAAYGSALRLERGVWKLELGGSLTLRPLDPEPGARKRTVLQIVSEISAGTRIEDAALWLDGRALPGRASGVSPTDVTVFTTLAAPAGPGRHTVVAFAHAGPAVTARAWAFTVAH